MEGMIGRMVSEKAAEVVIWGNLGFLEGWGYSSEKKREIENGGN